MAVLPFRTRNPGNEPLHYFANSRAPSMSIHCPCRSLNPFSHTMPKWARHISHPDKSNTVDRIPYRPYISASDSKITTSMKILVIRLLSRSLILSAADAICTTPLVTWPAVPGITTYTIVPDVIVVYGCSCCTVGSPKPSLVIGGSVHPVTMTVEQVVEVTHVVNVVHVVIGVHTGTQTDDGPS